MAIALQALAPSKKIYTSPSPSSPRATYAVTSSMRRAGARALWTRVTLETDTPAADAIWARMEDSCVVKAEGERLKRRTSCTSRPYLHLYPATHLQCTSRLD